MKRITMVIAGLGGRGHDIYGNYAMEHPDEVEICLLYTSPIPRDS